MTTLIFYLILIVYFVYIYDLTQILFVTPLRRGYRGGGIGGTCPPCQKKGRKEEEEERGKKRGKRRRGRGERGDKCGESGPALAVSSLGLGRGQCMFWLVNIDGRVLDVVL